MAKQLSFGENFGIIQDKKVSTVHFSEMKHPKNTKVLSLSDRLTPLLMSSGLVKGIIPTSMRKKSGQQILGTAFLPLAGRDGEKPKGD